MRKPKVLVIAGSTRKESVHRRLARVAAEALREAGAEAVVADLREYPMPLYDGDLEAEAGMPPAARKLKEMAREAEGFVFASPEYNGSYPAVLKNAIDWISRPEAGERPLAVFRGKPAGMVTASPGPHGGARALKELGELLGMIGVTVEARLGIADSGGALDGEGRLARAADAMGMESLAGAVARAAAEEDAVGIGVRA